MRLKGYSYEIEDAVRKCYLIILGRIPDKSGMELHSKPFKEQNIFSVSLGDKAFNDLRMRFILSEEFFSRYYEIKVLGVNRCKIDLKSSADMTREFFIFLFGYVPSCEDFFELFLLNGEDFSKIRYSLIKNDKIYKWLMPVLSKVFYNNLNAFFLTANKMMRLEKNERFNIYKGKLSECKNKKEYAYMAYVLLSSFMEKDNIKWLNEKEDFSELFRVINYPIIDVDNQILNVFKNHKDFFFDTSYNEKHKIDKFGFNCFGYRLSSVIDSKISYFLLNDNIGIFIFDSIVFIKEFKVGSPWNIYFEDLREKTVLSKKHLYKMYLDTVMKNVYENIKYDINFGITKAIKNKLRTFRKIYPNTFEYDYLMGLYYYRENNILRAEKYVKVGLNRVRLNYDLCNLMGDVFLKKGQYSKAVQYYMRLMIEYSTKNDDWIVDEKGNLNVSKDVNEKIISAFKMAYDEGKTSKEVLKYVNNELIRLRDSFMGRKYLVFSEGKFKLVESTDELDVLGENKKLFRGEIQQFGESYADYRIGDVYKCYHINQSSKLIVPIMPLEDRQELKIRTMNGEFEYVLGSNVVDRFRKRIWVDLNCSKQEVEIFSSKDFVVANPIRMKSSSERKVVVNIILDAFAFSRVKDSLELYMPNTKKFFERGIIFENSYAPAEWTQNSMPSILTGIMPERLQMYHPYVNFNLSTEADTIVDKLKAEGFYTINMFHDIPRFYTNGMYKAFDRHVNVDSIDQQIMKAIEILEHYTTDVFLNIHNLTIHESQLYPELTRMTSKIDTSILDVDVMLRSDYYSKEQSADNLDARKCLYSSLVKEVDKKLLHLYKYLNDNFSKENVFVSLISDHGSQSDNMKEFLLSHEHTNTAFMLYGNMIPCRGVIKDEIISSIDLYSVYEHVFGFSTHKRNCDSVLPKTLGGEGRDFAITQTIYPGQPYRMAINDLKYEFWFQTKGNVKYDGTYNLRRFSWRIFRQGRKEEIFDNGLLEEYLSKGSPSMKNLSRYTIANEVSFIRKKIEKASEVAIFLRQPKKGLYECFFLFLDSIISQTMGDFKVFIIERDIDIPFENCLREYMNKDMRIVLVQSEHNSLGGTLNILLHNTLSKYVIFFEEYQFLHPVTFSMLVNAATLNNVDIVYNLESNYKQEVVEDDIRVSFETYFDKLTEWKMTTSSRYGCLKLYSLQYLKNNKLFFYDLDEGTITLFDIRSFFHTDNILKIENTKLIRGILKNNIIIKPSQIMNSMMKYLNKIDEFVHFQSKLGIKDDYVLNLMKEEVMDIFYKKYICCLSNESCEKITRGFEEILQKESQISKWWVSYLFKRNINACR